MTAKAASFQAASQGGQAQPHLKLIAPHASRRPRHPTLARCPAGTHPGSAADHAASASNDISAQHASYQALSLQAIDTQIAQATGTVGAHLRQKGASNVQSCYNPLATRATMRSGVLCIAPTSSIVCNGLAKHLIYDKAQLTLTQQMRL